MSTSKISFVVTARNDDYGGNLVARFNAFISTLDLLCRENELYAEIVFVEYNPPEGKDFLYNLIVKPSSQFLSMKAVIVPNDFHKKLSQGSSIPVMEYVAKNIGVRRAMGEYVIATNPDIIFSKGIISYFKLANLSKDNFYRVDRYDLSVSAPEIPANLNTNDLMNFCRTNTSRILRGGLPMYLSYKKWFKHLKKTRDISSLIKTLVSSPIFNTFRTPFSSNEKIQDSAPGDFLMMHKDIWSEVCAYDETPTNDFKDSLILGVLGYCFGKRQMIIKHPIYHIKHVMARAGRPGMAMNEYKNLILGMKKTKQPYRDLKKNWGFPNENFIEIKF